ncbi:MAG: beta strand repeat-containing protein [Planctomycetaceae bacterium]
MKLSKYLKRLTHKNLRRQRAAERTPIANFEMLETKHLLSGSALFLPANGELSIEINNTDSVRVSSANGLVVVETINGGTTTALTSIGNIPSASVQKIVVLGSDEPNQIDLSGVTAASFTSLISILADGANGDDVLIGSPDFADSLIGGHGNDTLQGNGGIDTLIGGDGADSISGGTGADSITGGDGNDSINGDDGADNIAAGNGQDTVSGGNDNDTIGGANGNDVISGDAGDDVLNGDGGFDSISGGDGNDSILGGDLNDSLLGGLGNDTLNGQSGQDLLLGEDGNDSLLGGNGDDRLDGGLDNDTLNGNLGNDTATGNDGNDFLQGGAGNDSLDGGFGNDRVLGQGGDDTLTGGGESDTLDGGDGSDLVSSADVPAAGLPTVRISDATITEADGLFATLFNAANDVAVTDDNQAIAAADLDGDGDIDLATPASILLNTGTGLFAPAVATNSQADGFMDVGDVDGDGDIDIVIAGNPTGDIDLLINNGNGTFQAPRTAVDLMQFFGSSSVVLADVDGDGDRDLAAVIGFATPEVLVSLNNGNGTFQPVQQYAAGMQGASDLVAGDFDGDGDIDLAVAKVFFQSAIAFLRNNGDGTFQTGVLTTVSATPNAITAADFDNDGDLDIATGGATDTVLLNNGTGGFTASTPIANVGFFTSANDIEASDLDLDGDIDLATIAFNGQITLLENNGAGFFMSAGNPTLSTMQGFGTDLVLADLTGDNAPEIAVNDGFGQNNVSILRNTGATKPAAVFTLTLSAPSSVPVTVNFATADSFALAGRDYQPIAGTVTFAPGVTTATIRVSIEGDSIPEGTENFLVNLTSPTNAVLVDAQAQGLILDNDGGVTGPTLSIGNLTIAEGDSGTQLATATVTLSAPVGGTVTVQFNTVDGTALAGVDYSAVSGTLTFPNGTLTQTISVPIRGDQRNEGNENFFIALSNPVGVPLANTQAQITITDNDGALPASSANDTLLGGDGNDTLIGSIGDDVFNGQTGADSILGGEGNDALAGGAGIDTLDGQAGNDTLDGQGGDDLLLGGDGDDTFVLGALAGGQDSVDGGDGLNSIVANGTGNADTLSVGQASNLLVVTRGLATITATTLIQSVTVNGLFGNDTITVGNLSGVVPTVLTINGGDGDDGLFANGANIDRVRLFLNGENGNDSIVGSNGNDRITGGAGNDLANGGAGNDSITGQTGNDILSGGLGNDSISAGDGTDFVTGQEGDDSLDGGAGNDTIKGHEGNDTLQGQAGDDLINGMEGDDSILGGSGQDSLSGGSGGDTIDGGRNDDSINGNAGNDRIRGDHGNDFIDAGTDTDTVNGGDGHDTIFASDSNDLLNGGDGNDQINAGGGNDTITGGDGNDSIQGGGGNDVILGGDGDDVINGQGGTDTIAGNQGVDVISDPTNEIDENFVLSAALMTALLAAG